MCRRKRPCHLGLGSGGELFIICRKLQKADGSQGRGRNAFWAHGIEDKRLSKKFSTPEADHMDLRKVEYGDQHPYWVW